MPRFSKNRLSKNRLSKKHRRYKKRATRRLKGGEPMPKETLLKNNIKDLLVILADQQRKPKPAAGEAGAGSMMRANEKTKNIRTLVNVLNEKYTNAKGPAKRNWKLNSSVQDVKHSEEKEGRKHQALNELIEFAEQLKDQTEKRYSGSDGTKDVPIGVTKEFIVEKFPHLKNTITDNANLEEAARTYTLNQSGATGEQYRKPDSVVLNTGQITYNLTSTEILFGVEKLGKIKVLLIQVSEDNKMLTVYFITDKMMENTEDLKDKDEWCKLFHSFTIQLTNEEGTPRNQAITFSRAIAGGQQYISGESLTQIPNVTKPTSTGIPVVVEDLEDGGGDGDGDSGDGSRERPLEIMPKGGK